jgi:hypothetical protein
VISVSQHGAPIALRTQTHFPQHGADLEGINSLHLRDALLPLELASQQRAKILVSQCFAKSFRRVASLNSQVCEDIRLETTTQSLFGEGFRLEQCVDYLQAFVHAPEFLHIHTEKNVGRGL